MRKENLSGEAEDVKEVCEVEIFKTFTFYVFSMRDKWRKHVRRQRSGRRETMRCLIDDKFIPMFL